MSTAPTTTHAPHQFIRERAEAPEVLPGLSSSVRPRRAVIAGIGLLTPLGIGARQTWRALLDGESITDHARSAGEFDDSSPRVIQMACRAAAEAMRDANWKGETDETDDIATVVGTSKGSVESWLTPLQHMPGSTYVAGGVHPTALADIATAVAPGCGPRLTLSGACASGLLALIRGAMLIESGQARRVLVVAAEASVHPLFLASFGRLGILAPPAIGCRPFDRHRQGFLMSEAAAAVCLETQTDFEAPAGRAAGSPQAPQSICQAIAIEHYAQGADAAHLTSPDPGGTVLRHLINKVTKNRPVDLIHAHGTGTRANDPIELAALESAFATAPRASGLYSHKAALGHSLGAAGLISIVINTLAHRHNVIPPNPRTTDPLRTTRMTLHATACATPIRRSLALAAGFGGATAAVTLVSSALDHTAGDERKASR